MTFKIVYGRKRFFGNYRLVIDRNSAFSVGIVGAVRGSAVVVVEGSLA